MTLFTHDLLDRMLTRTDPDGTILQYTYDAAGNRASVTTPQGATTYTYDPLNRLTTVTDPDGGVTAYTYDAVGNRASVSYPNGTVAAYTYDNLNRLTQLVNSGPPGVMSSYVYTLGPAGNRTSVAEAHSGRTVDYTYDSLYRLTGESINDPVSGLRNITYAYDTVGNRLSKGDSVDGSTTYAYDVNNRLLNENTASGIITYSYDNNGNLIARNGLGINVTCTYDTRNRLLAVDDGLDVVGYTYDVESIRVQSTVNGTDVTNFLVDKNRRFAQVLLETDGFGVEKARYVYGDDLISQTRGGAASYYHYDGQMSSRQLTSSTGAVTDTYDYDAFGVMLNQTGITSNSYLYRGEFLDANSGDYYLRARWLGPTLGRFTSEDPVQGNIFEPQTLHKYVYVQNDPLNRFDPSGNFSMVEVSSVLGIIQALATVSGPQFIIAAATTSVLVKVWGPAIEARNGALETLAMTSDPLITKDAWEVYNKANNVISTGAVAVKLTNKMVDLAFSVKGLSQSATKFVSNLPQSGRIGIRQAAKLAGEVKALGKSAKKIGEDIKDINTSIHDPGATKQKAFELNKEMTKFFKSMYSILQSSN
jgi:RHS repeat-associated protein